MKTLDMADKYDPLSYQDEYDDPDSVPTIRVQVPVFTPQVVVGDDDPDGTRDTIPSPPPFPHEEQSVNVAAIAVVLATMAFWATVTYFIFR